MSSVSREILELHCFFDLSRKKEEVYHEYKGFDKDLKLKKGRTFKAPNQLYNPKPRPKWCEKLNPRLDPCFLCLGGFGVKPCPHVTASPATRGVAEVVVAAWEGFESTLNDESYDALVAADAPERDAFIKRVLDAEGLEDRSGYVVKKGSKKDPGAAWLRAAGFKKGKNGKWRL